MTRRKGAPGANTSTVVRWRHVHANIRGVQLQASIAKQPACDKFHQVRWRRANEVRFRFSFY